MEIEYFSSKPKVSEISKNENSKNILGKKYVKINDEIDIIPIENWKKYNCDMSEVTGKKIICKCCNII